MDEDTKNLIGKGLKLAGQLLENKPSEQALLAEYKVCQHEASASGSYGWQSGIIFFVTTLTLAGAVITGLANANASLYRLLLITILAAFSITLLCAWKKYASRQQFIRKIMYARMRVIEGKLGLRKNLYVDFLDNATEDETENNWKNEKWLPLTKAERGKLRDDYPKHFRTKPQGFKWITWVAWAAIIAWVVIILLEGLDTFFHIRICLDLWLNSWWSKT